VRTLSPSRKRFFGGHCSTDEFGDQILEYQRSPQMSDRTTAVKILEWIRANYPALILANASIREATDAEDKQRARDAVIDIPDADSIPVGYRSERGDGGKWVKIRSVKEGQPTELDKIRSGDCCQWYLYAWRDNRGIYAFALIDIMAMHEQGWFDESKVRNNFYWRQGMWDPLSGYIKRYLDWLKDDGFVLLYEVRTPKVRTPKDAAVVTLPEI
jgi:hypothetical protein